MKYIKGQYGNAVVFTDDIEASAYNQIQDLTNHPISENTHVRVMPDCHAGAGCVIGYTARIEDKVVPNLIGVDIGCGVLALRLKGLDAIDYKILDKFIRHAIPHGNDVRGSVHPRMESMYNQIQSSKPDHFKDQFPEDSDFDNFHRRINKICKTQGQDYNRVTRSIGSLGGGNHFIEIDQDQNSDLWLTIHCGSRNFGLKVANWHQKIAKKACGPMHGLEYLTDGPKDAYLRDMHSAQKYAVLNRYLILDDIARYLFSDFDLSKAETIQSVHNYIDFTDNIVRKGAISAHQDEMMIIPFNMAAGAIIAQGKGNPEWNFSAPHGTGRVMSRKQAKKTVLLKDFTESMKNVYSTSVGKATIDESPQVYKDPAAILALIEETCVPLLTLKPVYNFKAA